MATDEHPESRPSRHDRLGAIRELVKIEPRTIDELAEQLEISAMTVYRDVATLQQQGMVHRHRGVVTVTPSRTYESPATYRVTQNSAVKAALAQGAASLISAGDSVMLDDSSTGIYLARQLAEIGPLTVITNSLAVARELDSAEGVTVFLTGGQYAAWAEALYGPMTIHSLKSLRADVVVMSASAVSDDVCYHPDSQIAQVKQAFMAAAARRVLYLDKSKFDRTALHAVSNLAEFDTVVVEHGTDSAQIRHLEALGVSVVVAPAVTGSDTRSGG